MISCANSNTRLSSRVQIPRVAYSDIGDTYTRYRYRCHFLNEHMRNPLQFHHYRPTCHRGKLPTPLPPGPGPNPSTWWWACANFLFFLFLFFIFLIFYFYFYFLSKPKPMHDPPPRGHWEKLRFMFGPPRLHWRIEKKWEHEH